MHPTRRQACSFLAATLSLPTLSALTRAAPRPAAPPDPAALIAAVRRGDLERVRELLAADPALAGATDGTGRSAFVLAHLEGHTDVAELLRAAGLELDLVEAVLAEDWERAERLAKEHPDLLHRAHPIGGTPLYAAAVVGSLNCWRLRSYGCLSDAAPEGGTGFTPARGALESTHASWALVGLTDLCSNGGDVNARQRGGSSVLHRAVERRDATLVRLAVRKGAEVEAVDDAGRTPRALAKELGWHEGEQLLAGHARLPRDNRSSRFALDANREPVVRPDLSDVPQELQSDVTGNSHFNLEKVRELVSKDERLIFSISTDDELAIEACAHIGNRPIIRYHLDHGAPLSLPTAVSLGDLDAVDFWLRRDPTLRHERGAHDFPVMWYAVLGRGSVEMAELLSLHGVPLDQESMGTTALHWCVRRNDRDLARWLIDEGADPQAVGFRWSRDGQTPLQVAQADGSSSMATLLKDAGAR